MTKRGARSTRKGASFATGSAVRASAQRVIDRRAMAVGTLALPCLPSLLEHYFEQVTGLWRILGRRLGVDEQAQLRATLAQALERGFELSPHTLLIVQYDVHPAPRGNVEYVVQLKARSVEAYYEQWSSSDGGAWFGASADAKVMSLASALPRGARVLDVGAGHGRNALPLARLGLEVDALELVDSLSDRLEASARGDGLALRVIRADLLASELVLTPERYDLIVVSEVLSHLRDLDQLRLVLSRLGRALAQDGALLCNAFLADDGYVPDRCVREAAQAALSSVFTRPELASLSRALELTLLSDESVLAYERKHLPAEAWPPTSWFEDWAGGRNVVDADCATVPFELRWLLFRKAGTQA